MTRNNYDGVSKDFENDDLCARTVRRTRLRAKTFTGGAAILTPCALCAVFLIAFSLYALSVSGAARAAERSAVFAAGAGSAAGAKETADTKNGASLRQSGGVTRVSRGGMEMLLVNKEFPVPRDYGGGMDENAQRALDEMLAAAEKEKVYMYVGSGYRSYEAQSALYDAAVARSGAEHAEIFSARAGHSEHQTGLAADLGAVSDTSTYLERSFETTPEFAWLQKNAADFGFILRYGDGKTYATGYGYEPWHFRYVGAELAKAISESGLCVEEYFGLA